MSKGTKDIIKAKAHSVLKKVLAPGAAEEVAQAIAEEAASSVLEEIIVILKSALSAEPAATGRKKPGRKPGARRSKPVSAPASAETAEPEPVAIDDANVRDQRIAG